MNALPEVGLHFLYILYKNAGLLHFYTGYIKHAGLPAVTSSCLGSRKCVCVSCLYRHLELSGCPYSEG
jgi:hypothetical protein